MAETATYQVVARRYRPQRFDELVGQEHVARGLSGAIESGRIGHAYLFTGARGVGKTSAARIYAKALECSAGPSSEPCNTCDAWSPWYRPYMIQAVCLCMHMIHML